jgi:hypothetical protein
VGIGEARENKVVRLGMFVCVCILSWLSVELLPAQETNKASLCMDGFCIGESINDPRFDQVTWVLPKDGLTKEACAGIGCKPEVAFRGYPDGAQKQLAEVLSWHYGPGRYNAITKTNLSALRQYKYECNRTPLGIGRERRFIGAYRSIPSQYLTVLGLRLIDGQLKVYRIARQYPYHTPKELTALGQKLHEQYGEEVLFYNYLSSNAYSDVIEQKRNGWFARSTLFNSTDLADNAAELVLIDPKTRSLLEPTSMPESGEIESLAVKTPDQCSTSIPLR